MNIRFTGVSLPDCNLSTRSPFPPSLPPRESSATTNSLVISKKSLIASYCACLSKREPILHKPTVEPLEFAAYISSFSNTPKSEGPRRQYQIARLASFILSMIDQKKELAVTKQSSFRSFPQKLLLLEDAYQSGDAAKTAFYFECLHDEAYATVNPIKILNELYKSFTGRTHLPPILITALDALKNTGVTLQDAIKTYYDMEAKGELDGIEIRETLEQVKQRGRKVDEDAIERTSAAFYAVLAKHSEDEELRPELFKREVKMHMDTLGQGKKYRKSTADALWKDVPEERKLVGRPKGPKSDNKP